MLRKATEAEVGCSDQQRFIIELEFIQALSNPHYLTCVRLSAAPGVLCIWVHGQHGHGLCMHHGHQDTALHVL